MHTSVIAKSQTHIAIWDGEKTVVEPLGDSKIEIRFGKLEEPDK